MSLQVAGQNILDVEVTNISSHGIWLFTENQEFFMSYEDFPWFKEATIREILNVEQPSLGHFYWSDLDVDLSIKMIQNPQHYPLKSVV